MTSTNKIFLIAQKRSQEASLSYAGILKPKEAFFLLQSDQNIKLLDVRTQAERDWVGKIKIYDTQQLAVQWNLYPENTQNPNFLDELINIANQDTILLFLCRSGLRSHYAAELATKNGYARCYNILDGFEGKPDKYGHRKKINGWCNANLPWE